MEGRNTQSQYTDTGPASTDFFEWSLTVRLRHREHPNKRYRQTSRHRRMERLEIHDTRKACLKEVSPSQDPPAQAFLVICQYIGRVRKRNKVEGTIEAETRPKKRGRNDRLLRSTLRQGTKCGGPILPPGSARGGWCKGGRENK